MNGLIEVFILSLLPTFEGRYAVIYGIGRGYPIHGTLVIASVAIFILSFALPFALPFIDIIMLRLEQTKLKRIGEGYLTYINRVRSKARPYVEKWGFFGLIIFVAIPLPGTGVWTGSLAAYLFGMERKKTVPALIIGGLLSILITTIPTVGIASILG
ncbi:COG2426 family protein [Thermococcus sp.]